MKKNNTIINILTVMFLMLWLSSCSDKTIIDSSNEQSTFNIPLVEWGMTKTDVKALMMDYNIISSTNDCLLYNNCDDSEVTYVFGFYDEQLSVSAIIMPITDFTPYVSAYNCLGDIGQKRVYSNTNLNTIITLYPMLEVDSNLCAVGFSPIISNAFEEYPLPKVTTNEAIILDYTSAELSGSVEDLFSGDTYGIIFGNKSTLSDGIKLKATDNDTFSFTINQMEMGKKYYYCSYVDAGDVTYYGKTLSCFMPLPDINVTTGEVEDVTSYTVTLNGSANISLQYDVDYDYGFFLSTKNNPSKENHVLDVTPSSIMISNFKVTLNDLKDNTTYYCCAYVLCQGRYFYGTTNMFITPKATKGTLVGHNWVDLGLPSGLRWATCNVGASTPSEYGNYFAWGEIKSKGWFSSSNYPNGNNNNDLPYDITGTKYDVARQDWGSTWQMPSFSDICELYKYCKFSWETVDGVAGARLTGKNGNSIFLPAGGAIGKSFPNGISTVSHEGTGRYWTSTMAFKQNSNEVKCMWFSSKGFQLTTESLGITYDMYINGFNGLLVRPVTK